MTQGYSQFFPWDWNTAWLGVLYEATQEACAIHYRMAADLSSRVVLCALLSSCFSRWDPQHCHIPAPEVVYLETVYLFSGIKQN